MAKYFYNNSPWDWDYAKDELREAFKLNVYPSPYDYPHYDEGDVIDEEQSVRWNREEIVRRNNARKEEENRLIEYRKQRIAEVGVDVIEALAEYFIREHKVSKKMSQLYANEIWNFVINDEDVEMDEYEVFKHIDKYVAFLVKILKKNDENK